VHIGIIGVIIDIGNHLCYTKQGMPDFNPPSYVMEALAQAAQSKNLAMQQYSRGQVRKRKTDLLAVVYL
jgi:hypothetical protein